MWESFSFASMPNVRLNLDDSNGPSELGVTVSLAVGRVT
jgi:hypothetical protein